MSDLCPFYFKIAILFRIASMHCALPKKGCINFGRENQAVLTLSQNHLNISKPISLVAKLIHRNRLNIISDKVAIQIERTLGKLKVFPKASALSALVG